MRGDGKLVGRSGSPPLSPLSDESSDGTGREGRDVVTGREGGGAETGAGSDSTVARSNTDFRSAVSMDGVSWMSGRIRFDSEKFWIATA